jgi:hypothetical protein
MIDLGSYAASFTDIVRNDYWHDIFGGHEPDRKRALQILSDVDKLRSVSPVIKKLIIAERCEEYGLAPSGLPLSYIRFKKRQPYWPGEQIESPRRPAAEGMRVWVNESSFR